MSSVTNEMLKELYKYSTPSEEELETIAPEVDDLSKNLSRHGSSLPRRHEIINYERPLFRSFKTLHHSFVSKTPPLAKKVEDATFRALSINSSSSSSSASTVTHKPTQFMTQFRKDTIQRALNEFLNNSSKKQIFISILNSYFRKEEDRVQFFLEQPLFSTKDAPKAIKLISLYNETCPSKPIIEHLLRVSEEDVEIDFSQMLHGSVLQEILKHPNAQTLINAPEASATKKCSEYMSAQTFKKMMMAAYFQSFTTGQITQSSLLSSLGDLLNQDTEEVANVIRESALTVQAKATLLNEIGRPLAPR